MKRSSSVSWATIIPSTSIAIRAEGGEDNSQFARALRQRSAEHHWSTALMVEWKCLT